MDDLFLYNHIKQAIKQKKQISKDASQGNFAENYCRRQLMKKKLNFNNANKCNNKMKNLMKNFTHVDTYVDLNQLLFSINQIRAKEKAQKQISKIQQKQRISRLSKLHNIFPNNLNLSSFSPNQTTPYSSLSSGLTSPNNNFRIDPMSCLKDKVRDQINELIKKKYQQQNNQMQELISALQEESHLRNSLLKNHSSNYISYLNQQLERIEKDEEIDGEACPDNWKIFRQLNQTLNQDEVMKRDQKKEYFRSTNLNSKQKKQQNQLLHKISTFLQIALQNEHKQKWATKQMKKFRSTHGSFRFKKNDDQRSKFFLKGIQMEKQNKQVFENMQTPKNRVSRMANFKRSPKKQSTFMRKIKSQQRNIFGKKSIDKHDQERSQINSFMDRKSQKRQKSQPNEKQNPSKIFQRTFQRTETRNTAPIFREDNRMESFAGQQIKITPPKQFSQTNPILINPVFRQQAKNSFLIKKSYQLNKGRRNRQYNFISPQRSHCYNTINLGSPLDKTQDPVINRTCQNFPTAEVQKSVATASNYASEQQFSLKKSSSQTNSLSSTIKGKNISQNFTFKKRNKKQKLLNKLEAFIQQINEQQKISKLQNQYYDSAINYMIDLSKTTYKNYEPQTLAGVQQVKELKKFLNNINPSLKKNKGSLKKKPLR